jgi:coenzyme Q-binding protein COQ10
MSSATIQAIDARVVPFSPEQVWAVLADVPSSPRWWPASVRLRVLTATPAVVGTEFEIRPRGGRAFRARVEEIEAPRRLRLRYGNGFVTGTGEWRLAPVPGGTRVEYALDVRAHGWLVAVLGALLPLGKVHSRSMGEVLASLEAEVRRRG